MATKTSLIINAVNEGKTLQKAIADVNPQATTAELRAFAQGMLGLTDYTYTNGALVERTGIDGNTNDLPWATGSFWFNGVNISPQPSLQVNYNFSLAELATLAAQSGTNVTHANGRYKIFVEIRDMYYGNIDCIHATTGGILLYDQGHRHQSKPGVDDLIKVCVTFTGLTSPNMYAIACEIPDTMPEGVTDWYEIAFVQILGSTKFKPWALDLGVLP